MSTVSPDILSDTLRALRLRGALYFHVSGVREWVAEAPPSREIAGAVLPGAEHVMEFHVVLAGACWAALVGGPAVQLGAGDLVFFPHGDAHVVSSAPGMRAPPNVAGYFERDAARAPRPFALHLDAQEVRMGVAPAAESDAVLVCGFLGCDLRPFNPLIGSLPPLLHVRALPGQDWVVQCVRQAVVESTERGPGAGAMLERLSEMMFIEVLRRYVATLPDESRGWIAGLRDRQIGRVLALIHQAPAEPWTVDELGRRVGLSRSALHERFAELIGMPPMQYLAQWRLQLGASLLRDTRTNVGTIAAQVGYDSEAAFGRAFKRLVGQPPARWRRGVREAAE
jgi:AraC-like DNA-binding protein